jgi:diguanylate cyclase (GGDEF)-like protein/PAS domain S-box-containing protein
MEAAFQAAATGRGCMVEVIYRCIVLEHDYRLVMLAVLICLFASYTAVSLQERARGAVAKQREKWIGITAITIGTGIWATHFIAMLGYDAGMAVRYDLLPTLGSLLVAILVSGLGFHFATYHRTKRARGLAGLVVGLGIAGMHYIGMMGYRVQGTISHDPDYILLSLVFGIGFAGASLVGMNKTRDIVRHGVATSLLVAAICGLHFTAMAGMQLTYDPTAVMPEMVLSEGLLVFTVAILALILLGFSLSHAFLDKDGLRMKRLETARLQSLADAALEGIVVMDMGGHIVTANQSFIDLSGKKMMELRGHPLRRYFRQFTGDDNISALAETGIHLEEAMLLQALGDEVPTEIFFRHAVVSGEPQLVAVVRDLREKRAAEQQISYLSNYDVLTGLANRQLMMDRLLRAVPAAIANDSKIALHYIDVDGFKELNTTIGQEGGDHLLRVFAARIQHCVKEIDTVARIGADQFCVIQESISRAENADILVEDMIRRLEQPFVVSGREAFVSVSVGIAVAPDDTEDASSILSRAEIAMKQAKTVVGNSYRFYEEALDQTQLLRRQLKRDLVGAIERGEMKMVFQPQFDVRSGDATGFEALVRWTHPERGPIGPAEFIPLAEESGQILELGAWIIEESVREAAGWKNPLKVAINVSPVQFQQETLPTLIESQILQYGLNPARLEIEITEGVLINDIDHALSVLGRLRMQGIKLAMDDFGTGYSSLSYLQRFPFDKLKIDQSFVRKMLKDEQSHGIVRGMIGLAHGLNIPILAEGVETDSEFAMLRVEGCDEIQGYFLGKPKDISEYRDLVNTVPKATNKNTARQASA